MAVQPADVVLVNLRRVRQHDAAEVARRRRRVDVAGETAPAQMRQVAAVIDVGVRQQHRVDLLRIKGKLPVALQRLGASPLVEPAVEQQPRAIDFNEVLRSRRRAGRAAKGDFHDGGTPIPTESDARGKGEVGRDLGFVILDS